MNFFILLYYFYCSYSLFIKNNNGLIKSKIKSLFVILIIIISYIFFSFIDEKIMFKFQKEDFNYHLENDNTIMSDLFDQSYDNDIQSCNESFFNNEKINRLLQNLFNKYVIESSDGMPMKVVNQLFSIKKYKYQAITSKHIEFENMYDKYPDHYFNLNNLQNQDILSFIICNILQKDNKPIDYETFNNFFMYKNKIKKFLLMQNENIDYGKEKNNNYVLQNIKSEILLKHKKLIFRNNEINVINDINSLLSNQFSQEEVKLIRRLSVIYFKLIYELCNNSYSFKKMPKLIKKNNEIIINVFNKFYEKNNISNFILRKFQKYFKDLYCNDLNLGIYQTDIIIQILLIESILNFYFQRIIYKELFENKPDNDFYKSLKNNFFKNFIDEHSLMINNFEYLNGSLMILFNQTIENKFNYNFFIKNETSINSFDENKEIRDKLFEELNDFNFLKVNYLLRFCIALFIKDFLDDNINQLFNNVFNITNKKFSIYDIKRYKNKYFYFKFLIKNILNFQTTFNQKNISKDNIVFKNRLYNKFQNIFFSYYNKSKIIYIPLVNADSLVKNIFGFIISLFFNPKLRIINKILFNNYAYYINNKIDDEKLKFNQLIFNHSPIFSDYNLLYYFFLPFLFKKIFNKDLNEFFYDIIIKSYLFKIIFKQIKSISFFNKVINDEIFFLFKNSLFRDIFIEVKFGSLILFIIFNLIPFILAKIYTFQGKKVKFYNYFSGFLFDKLILIFSKFKEIL